MPDAKQHKTVGEFLELKHLDEVPAREPWLHFTYGACGMALLSTIAIIGNAGWVPAIVFLLATAAFAVLLILTMMAKDTVYDCPSNNTRDVWAPWTRRLSNDMFPGEYAMNPWIRADERPNPDGPNVNCRDDGTLNKLKLNPSRVWVTTDCNWTNPDHWPRIATPGYHDGGQAVIAHREANNFAFADGHGEFVKGTGGFILLDGTPSGMFSGYVWGNNLSVAEECLKQDRPISVVRSYIPRPPRVTPYNPLPYVE